MNNLHNQHMPRVLILFYSFSGQTSGLLSRLTAGLEERGVFVVTEHLRPIESLRFPVGTYWATMKMMLTTFFRKRIRIKEVSAACFDDFDVIILAGPTWSYNPSGPVLSLLDQYGKKIFKGNKVIPVISCRGYWRLHWYGLRKILRQYGAEVVNKIIFTHPNKEPWRTVGVFLKLAGKNPEKSPFWGRHYSKYGHSMVQQVEAYRFGLRIGEAINEKKPLADIDFMTPEALP
jgi:multimeric flavodoxin WrbA